MALLKQSYVVDKERGVVHVGWIVYVGHNSIEEEGWEEDTEKYKCSVGISELGHILCNSMKR